MTAQTYDNADEFHRHIAALNHDHGRGTVLAIVWADSKPALYGMYVAQLRFGIMAYHFRVVPFSNGYTLKARGRTQSVKSEYFNKKESS